MRVDAAMQRVGHSRQSCDLPSRFMRSRYSPLWFSRRPTKQGVSLVGSTGPFLTVHTAARRGIHSNGDAPQRTSKHDGKDGAASGVADGGSKVCTTSHSAQTTSQCGAVNDSGCASPQRTVGASSASSSCHYQAFSQGLTEFRWRQSRDGAPYLTPSVLPAETARKRFRLFGMPKGYPATTADGFYRFFYLSQANSFIADFSACIGYQSLLSGFFLGSSPQMWMLKDLFPALIAAYMANRLVSYESRPKQWFCVSVLLRNVTIVADMVIPTAFPNHLVVCAVGNAVMKQSSALMFFITRAAALQHYAIDNNLAELTKKFNSFSMVTFTLATALALVYCTVVTTFTAQLTTILVCCVANIALSYLSMLPIAFRILNLNTMHILLHAYLHNKGEVMTPQEVSTRLGMRMSAASALPAQHVGAAHLAAHLLYVSPPMDKLEIRTDTLDEDIVYIDAAGRFLLALWRPSTVPLSLRESWQRWELPAVTPRFLRQRGCWHSWWPTAAAAGAREAETRFDGHRLCLVVQQACPPVDLVRAHLLMHTAVLQHGATQEQLRLFLRQCSEEPAVWEAKGTALFSDLREKGWDVLRPALDHPDFRLSELPVYSVDGQRAAAKAAED